MLEEGQNAPDFELPDHDDETVRLSDFEGERVVLYFYPKAGTEGCTLEANRFADAWDEFRERDVQVLGVSTDGVKEIAAFREDEGIPFPLLSDDDGSVAKLYETFGTTEADGESHEIAFRNTYVIGPDGTIEAVYEGVSPEDHADQILDDVEELTAT